MKIKVINKSKFELPKYETKGSSGMDLKANKFYTEDNWTIEPKETILVLTGLFLDIPEGYEAQIRPRSGLSLKKGLVAQLGTIDSDYKGEIGIILHNNSEFAWDLTAGDRLAQMVFAKVERVNLELTEELTESGRGNNGFGSTGV